MELVTMNVADIRPYENNPRINDEAVKAVAESIRQCGYVAPIIVDEDNVILAGHTRLKALMTLGRREVEVIVRAGLNDEQKRKYRLLDNKTAELAEWDFDKLELELDGLDFDGFDFGFDLGDDDLKFNGEGKKASTISDRYLMPPFSVLDARSGPWQARKREWIGLGIKSGEGRDRALLSEGLDSLARNSTHGTAMTGTSIFDPVLAELMYYWFCIPGGRILDPFAGGSVRGVVASYLGYDYLGIDLSQRQIDEDNMQAEAIGVTPHYICDDSQNADKYVDDGTVDMVFSCPPYADLEVYSDDPRDISNMDYPDFLRVYRAIIRTACRKLKDNRFACFVVGDVRDKDGAYRNFVKDTQDAFADCGLRYYNDIILVTQVGTGALRVARQFNGGRKVVKSHQNVLVYYKGDMRKIKSEYPPVDIDETMVQELCADA